MVGSSCACGRARIVDFELTTPGVLDECGRVMLMDAGLPFRYGWWGLQRRIAEAEVYSVVDGDSVMDGDSVDGVYNTRGSR
jgi:hypothetical protein